MVPGGPSRYVFNEGVAGMYFDHIQKPTMLVDERKVRANIAEMAAKARRSGVIFRPHFKTHQSLEIGRLFKDEGVEKITVSSLAMAGYFAKEWNDITIAFPFNIREIQELNFLSKKGKISVLLESVEVTAFLNKNLDVAVGFYIKIDAGYHRTGLDPFNYEAINAILEEADQADKLIFKGFLSHSGHSYHSTSGRIREIFQDTALVLDALKKKYETRWPGIITSVGDTPSCSLIDHFDNVDEVRPGNFVFYDVMQEAIGACKDEQIAVAIACPVVAKHTARKEIVIYGGAVHLSKDMIIDEEGNRIFGKIAFPSEKGWTEALDGTELYALSQEHGVLRVPDRYWEEIHIGDLLCVLPVHSCLSASVSNLYLSTHGKVISKM